MRQDESRLSGWSPAELRIRAAQFQQMAKDARPVEVAGALLRIADRYETLAEKREQMRENRERIAKEEAEPKAHA